MSRAGSFSESGETENEAMNDYYFIKRGVERVWIQKLLLALSPSWTDK
jgi:hypothetical protein